MLGCLDVLRTNVGGTFARLSSAGCFILSLAYKITALSSFLDYETQTLLKAMVQKVKRAET